MRLTGRRRAGRSFPVSPQRGRRGTRTRTSSSRSSPSCSASNAWNSTRGRSPLRSACDPDPIVGMPIRPRVAENGRVLVESYRVLAQAIKEERTITPAAEWLVDNFSIVDEQIREIRDDLPPDYYRELPKLAGGHLDGLSARARAGVGVHRPHRQPVRSREPAADGPRLPGGGAADDRRAVGDRHQPAHPARREPAPARRTNRAQPGGPPGRRRARRPPARPRRRRRERRVRRRRAGCRAPSSRPPAASSSSSVSAIRTRRSLRRCASWSRLLASQGTTAEELVQLEHQRMATMNVTVRNVITSMRLISWFDWAEFVESVGLVDEVLRSGSRFAEMDFATRNRYRNAVEELARRSHRTEVEVARRAVDMARNARRRPTRPTRRRGRDVGDPGYYLISDGRADLERALGARVPSTRRIERALMRAGGALYVGLLALVTAFVIGLWFLLSGDRGVACSSSRSSPSGPPPTLAVAVVNRAVTRSLGSAAAAAARPRRRRADRDANARRRADAADEHRRRRRAGGGAWRSTTSATARATCGSRCCPIGSMPTASTPTATTICSRRRRPASIDSTNGTAMPRAAAPASCSSTAAGRWNAGEDRWMGWERKRGKLEELNALLRGSTTTSFLTSPAPRSLAPAGVRYVVTLDADTRLPRGVVGRLVGTMAHPLNQPSFDARLGRVTARVRPAAATHHADAARARGRVDLPAGLRRVRRHRPVRDRRLRRLSRPLPGGQLHRQGDLRRRRVRSRRCTTGCPRTRC